MSPDFGRRGPWGAPLLDTDLPRSSDCLESVIKAMLVINGRAEESHECLTGGGWGQAENSKLQDEIVVSRLLHEMEDDLKAWDQSKFDLNRESLLAWRNQLTHLRVYTHPSAPGSLIETSLMIGPVVHNVVAAFFTSDFAQLAKSRFQGDDIKRRFIKPNDRQSSTYSVGWGGQRVSASIREHGRDGDDFFYESRVSRRPLARSWLSEEGAHPVFAEMRLETRRM